MTNDANVPATIATQTVADLDQAIEAKNAELEALKRDRKLLREAELRAEGLYERPDGSLARRPEEGWEFERRHGGKGIRHEGWTYFPDGGIDMGHLRQEPPADPYRRMKRRLDYHLLWGEKLHKDAADLCAVENRRDHAQPGKVWMYDERSYGPLDRRSTGAEILCHLKAIAGGHTEALAALKTEYETYEDWQRRNLDILHDKAANLLNEIKGLQIR